MLKAIIVDDEQASRDTLLNYLSKYCAGVQVIAQGDSVATAIPLIHKHNPDIVFLDVEMPYGNAFDLLQQVGDITFETIFVTAFSHYALKALNLSASYYILKPIDIDELITAVNKIADMRKHKKESLHNRIIVENINTVNKQLQKLVLPRLDGFDVVQVSDIIRCQANDNFTEFFFNNGKKELVCRTLKFYEDTLTDYGFIRIHKSHLVNSQYIKRYVKGKNGTIIMTDGSELELSQQRREQFLEQFGRI
ncbi:MAG TPA: LytTR family DNA-binding domain-containing protein [Cytophagales bacterium]|nr:LytTR family DNA-binding domain-containing protein [Cytophagales bacterium]